MPYETLSRAVRSEPSAVIKTRVARARHRQRARLKPLNLRCNAELRHRDLRTLCPLTPPAAALLRQAMREMKLSARAYDKCLKLARTRPHRG